MNSIAFLAVILSSNVQSASKTIVPEPLTAFHGYEWCDIHLDETTDKQLKSKYRTNKGAFRPEAVILSQPRGAIPQIQAVTNARGERALVCAIRLEYSDHGPDVADLARAAGVEIQSWYAPIRYDNWRVDLLDRNGLVAFVNSNRKDTVSYVLLCNPSRIEAITSRMQRTPSEFSDFQELRSRLSQPILVSDVRVTLFSPDVSFLNSYAMGQSLSDGIRSMRGTRYVEFGRGRGGSKCEVSTSVTYSKDSGGTVSSNATITAQTSIGKLQSNGSGTDTFGRMGERPELGNTRLLERSVERAVIAAAQELDQMIKKLIPSSPEDLHDEEFNRLIDFVVPIGRN